MELIFLPWTRHILSLLKLDPNEKQKTNNPDKENSLSCIQLLALFKHLLSTYRGDTEMEEDSVPGYDPQ